MEDSERNQGPVLLLCARDCIHIAWNVKIWGCSKVAAGPEFLRPRGLSSNRMLCRTAGFNNPVGWALKKAQRIHWSLRMLSTSPFQEGTEGGINVDCNCTSH